MNDIRHQSLVLAALKATEQGVIVREAICIEERMTVFVFFVQEIDVSTSRISSGGK